VGARRRRAWTHRRRVALSPPGGQGPSSVTVNPTPYTLHRAPCTVHRAPYTQYRWPPRVWARSRALTRRVTLSPGRGRAPPADVRLHPTQMFTLHRTPFIRKPLHPTPYTLHPTLLTLHPRPGVWARSRALTRRVALSPGRGRDTPPDPSSDLTPYTLHSEM
jgi:hypothetical protein